MLYFALSMISYTIQNLSNKEYGRRCPGGSFIQNGVCVFLSALLLLFAGGAGFMSVELMLLAGLFGVLYLTTIFLLVRSFSLGSLGATMMICNIGMFISSIYGVLAFGDELRLGTALGALYMLAAVILCTPRGDNKKAGMKWFICALGAGVANGAVSSVKGSAVRLFPDCSANIFLMWGFAFSALIFAVITIFRKPVREGIKENIEKALIPAIICGIGGAVGTIGGNLFQMKALEQLSSVIVYPFTAGITVIMSWLISLIVYREVKLKLSNIAALLCCLTAIALINFL